ncbi:MogA/MoaB family molybdenum cofactor biosynthesis protein [Anaerolineales bacterium]
MSHQEHHDLAGQESIAIALVTVSDTRTPATDKNYAYLESRLQELGHQIVEYLIVKDEADQIEQTLDLITDHTNAQLILFNGGTGLSPRDTTYDVISRKLEKTLPGFGEIFRMLSYEEIGAAAILSRATAGVYKSVFVVSMPGSPNAVKMAMENLIIPEINHLVWELNR